MATLIAIFNLVACAASIVGLISMKVKNTVISRRINGIVFLIAVVFSIYTLFVPGNAIVENVESKIKLYQGTGETVLVQENEFSFDGFGPYEIQFSQPFHKPPKVIVINENGYDEDYVPYVTFVTNHHFRVKRSAVGGVIPHWMQTFKWVAQGTPMTPLKE